MRLCRPVRATVHVTVKKAPVCTQMMIGYAATIITTQYMQLMHAHNKLKSVETKQMKF